MNMVKRALLMATIAVFYLSCSDPREFFEFTPLESLSFDSAAIATGDSIRILAYAGGKANEKDKIYYSQFFCIKQPGGDSIIVLCPVIGYNHSDTDTSKVHSAVFMFNPPPDLLTATYRPINDAALGMLIHSEKIQAKEPSDPSDFINGLKPGLFQHLVIANKKMPEFDMAKHKAAVGFLYFSKAPWQ